MLRHELKDLIGEAQYALPPLDIDGDWRALQAVEPNRALGIHLAVQRAPLQFVQLREESGSLLHIHIRRIARGP